MDPIFRKMDAENIGSGMVIVAVVVVMLVLHITFVTRDGVDAILVRIALMMTMVLLVFGGQNAGQPDPVPQIILQDQPESDGSSTDSDEDNDDPNDPDWLPTGVRWRV